MEKSRPSKSEPTAKVNRHLHQGVDDGSGSPLEAKKKCLKKLPRPTIITSIFETAAVCRFHFDAAVCRNFDHDTLIG